MIKKLFITSIALFISGCGFTPMNAPSSIGDTTALRNIKVEMIEPESINSREAGYFIQQHLLNRIGTHKDAKHVLKFEPKTSRGRYGVSSNDVASRYDLSITTKYSLVDRATGEILEKGDVRAVSTFGSSSDPYARITAEKTATDQVSRDVADRLLIRLASYYKDPDRQKKARQLSEEERIELIRNKYLEQGYTEDQIEDFLQSRQ